MGALGVSSTWNQVSHHSLDGNLTARPLLPAVQWHKAAGLADHVGGAVAAVVLVPHGSLYSVQLGTCRDPRLLGQLSIGSAGTVHVARPRKQQDLHGLRL